MLQAGAWAGFAALSLLLGAVLALKVNVSRRHVGEAMGFGAGALIAALAYELIPNKNVSDIQVWISFGIGAVVFYALDALIERRSEASSGGGSPAGSGQTIALGALLDGIPESMVLGMSLAIGGSVSIGFLVAVFVSNVPESLSSSAEMRATRSAGAIYRMWTAIVIVSAIAGAVGYGFVQLVPSSDGRYVQAFAAGAVLTMLADSLIPAAVEHGGKRVALVTTLGFAVAAVLTTLE
jgi:zinc transporter, ZIP family